jgi:hypothetical protein
MTGFTRICAQCGKPYEAQTDRSRFCSTACRMKSYRRRRRRKAQKEQLQGEVRA